MGVEYTGVVSPLLRLLEDEILTFLEGGYFGGRCEGGGDVKLRDLIGSDDMIISYQFSVVSPSNFGESGQRREVFGDSMSNLQNFVTFVAVD